MKKENILAVLMIVVGLAGYILLAAAIVYAL